jgi:hypothetical protein
MTRLRVLLLAIAVALVVPLAHADSIPIGDPVVKTGGSPPAAPGSAPAAIITLNFIIESPSGTSPGTSPCDLIQGPFTTVSPLCFFQNEISISGQGQTINMLTFDALGINSNTVSCDLLTGSPFSQCGVDPLGNNAGTQITFFDGLIPFGGEFTLDFGGFPKNFTFGTTATATPDPSTFGLVLLGGLAALIARRKMVTAGSRR